MSTPNARHGFSTMKDSYLASRIKPLNDIAFLERDLRAKDEVISAGIRALMQPDFEEPLELRMVPKKSEPPVKP